MKVSILWIIGFFFSTLLSAQIRINFRIPEDTRKSIEYDAGVGKTLKDALNDLRGKPVEYRFQIDNPKDSIIVQIGSSGCSFGLIRKEAELIYKIEFVENRYKVIAPNNVVVCGGLFSGALSDIKITRFNYKQIISSEEDIKPENIPPVSFLDAKTVQMMLSPWKKDTSTPSKTIENLDRLLSKLPVEERTKQLKKLLKKLNEPSNGSSAQQPKNVLELDLLNPSFPKPKFTVGRLLSFEVTNYNPYRDSVAIKIAFADHHPNAEKEFKALVEKQFRGTESTADKGTGNSDTTSTGRGEALDKLLLNSIKGTNAVIKGFHRDMTTLHERLFTQKTLNPDSLEVGILRIDRAIASNFGLPSGSVITASTIQARAMELIEKHEAVEKTAMEQMIKEGVAAYGKIKDYNRLVFFPEQIDNKDYTEIIYNVKLKDKWSKDLTIRSTNRWGSGFGYSLGVMGSGLRNYTYGLRQVPTVQTRPGSTERDTVFVDTIYQTNNGKYNLGPLVLGHYYTRFPGGIAAAVSTGWGVNGQLDNHFFLGASLMVGRKNDLVVSAGWNWAKVNRLEGKYTVGDKLPVVKGTVNSVTTQSVWERGCFLSITKQM